MKPRVLFTEQDHDLRHFNDRRRRDLGTYAQQPAIMAAQSRLYDEVLHDDQLIWCSPDRPEMVPLEQPRYLHTIQLHRDDLVAVLDGFVWENIIGRHIPVDVRLELRLSTRHGDEASRHERLREAEERYLAEHLPRDPWKEVVVKEEDDCMMPVFLLRWPFRQSLIVAVEVIRA